MTSKTKYNAVIFDMDGTTLNTLEDLCDSVNFALSQYGYPGRTLSEVRSFVGNGVSRLMELSVPEGCANPQFESCLSVFRAHYAENMRNKTAPYPGILEVLRELEKRGYRFAIVSNKFDAAVKGLNRQYFGDFIQVAIGETENVRKKPAPDSVLKALEELGTAAGQAVYVGDSEVDVETARNAGLVCIGVTWGFRDRSVLQREGADYIIDKPEELLSILE